MKYYDEYICPDGIYEFYCGTEIEILVLYVTTVLERFEEYIEEKTGANYVS
jgi:hypothetical protein